jgi:hypothetical protein
VVFFSSDFPTRTTLYSFFLSSTRATHPAHLSLFDLDKRIISGKSTEQKHINIMKCDDGFPRHCTSCVLPARSYCPVSRNTCSLVVMWNTLSILNLLL